MVHTYVHTYVHMYIDVVQSLIQSISGCLSHCRKRKTKLTNHICRHFGIACISLVSWSFVWLLLAVMGRATWNWLHRGTTITQALQKCPISSNDMQKLALQPPLLGYGTSLLWTLRWAPLGHSALDREHTGAVCARWRWTDACLGTGRVRSSPGLWRERHWGSHGT